MYTKMSSGLRIICLKHCINKFFAGDCCGQELLTIRNVSDHLWFFQMSFTVSTGILYFTEAFMIASDSVMPKKMSLIIKNKISIAKDTRRRETDGVG